MQASPHNLVKFDPAVCHFLISFKSHCGSKS
jgi:hypothetical protein